MTWAISKLKENSLTETIDVNLDRITKLTQFLVTNTWSPYIYEGRYRKAQNFKEAYFFALDVDKGLTIEEAQRRLETDLKVQYIIAPTKSHTEEAHRFRIIFPLNPKAPLKSKEQVYVLFRILKKFFPEADDACKDPARLFYPSKSIACYDLDSGTPYLETPQIMTDEKEETTNVETTLVMRERYGKLPLSKVTLDFLKNNAPKGERHKALIKAAKDARQQLWTLQEFMEAFNKKNHEWLSDVDLLSKGLKQLEAIFNDPEPPRHPPRLPPAALKTQHLPDNVGLAEVFRWLDEQNLKISYDRTIKNEHNEELAIDALNDLLILALAARNVSVSAEVRRSAITRYIEERRHHYRQGIVEKLVGSSDVYDYEKHKGEVEAFLKVYNPNPTPLDVAALSHTIWQIKRKLLGLPVINHMMFVIYGKKQGTGKSYGLQKFLISPLEDLALENADFNVLTDPREARVLNDSFVIVFDEMSNADRAGMEAIKRIISADKFKQRIMGTTQHTHLKVNSTFLGSTNRPINHLIMDYTGMRRFYQFNVADDRPEEVRARWKKLNDINYLSLYQALDPYEPSPLSHYHDALALMQDKELRHKRPIELWIEDSGDVIIDPEADTLASDLLQYFNRWNVGQIYNPTSFGRELLTVDGIVKKRTATGTRYGLRLIKNNSSNF